jgi:hypothetical protein
MAEQELRLGECFRAEASSVLKLTIRLTISPLLDEGSRRYDCLSGIVSCRDSRPRLSVERSSIDLSGEVDSLKTHFSYGFGR